MSGRQKTIIFLLLVGTLVLSYPALRSEISEYQDAYILKDLRKQLEVVDRKEQKELAKAYNRRIRENQEIPAEEYQSILNITNGIMGVISIPAIAVELPIYHGVSDDILSKGVGHLPRSALPIGGKGNHAVLTGHTGYPGAVLFTNLTELKEGDLFYIEILGETLTYQIDQIMVVRPDEGEALAAEPGKDYCTLVTCTPYGVNSHRLLVRGVRIDGSN